MDRASCVWIVRENAYVWPRGHVVHIYGYVQWARRMTGMTTDVGPHTSVYVAGFAEDDDFRQWCRTYDRQRQDEATSRTRALIRNGRTPLAPPDEQFGSLAEHQAHRDPAGQAPSGPMTPSGGPATHAATEC